MSTSKWESRSWQRKYHVAPRKTRIVVSLAFVDGTNAPVYALQGN
ncbi:Os01g0899387 [Oryza sativa Japonica Group]|uniref:Os01g0899387 protein n=1 Tax=Oryza sativa subsp. japonica TaxID=39947 RepID=A0A0P0VBJ8_ORYSJ|nr:hypothetical protein EE612_007388 [Oryza sativa]BAS75734.1 Os01g0899387 [Oryza sativa Japonica Group]